MDPTTLETPHIHNLHDDILLHIFNVNTLTAEAEHSAISSTYRRRKYYPLNTTCNASQVCRYWRRLILEYPSIWGCLIDLDIIRSDAWAEEVMARAGSAYLSVYGQIGRTQQSTSFFTYLVANHWDRICKIHVSVAWDFPLDQSVWKVIQDRPAPNLESFVFEVNSSIQLSAPCNGPLFANSAPSLRRFHDCGSRFFNLSLNFAWLYQLSSVTLSNSLSTTDVLNILNNSVQLESLTLRSIVFDHSARGWTKQIHLPRLARIDIHADAGFEEVLLYLKYIVPKYGCALLLFSHVTEEELEEGLLDDVYLPSFAKSIASYSTSYFNLHKPTKFYIADDFSSFSFYSEKDTEMVYFGHPKLDLFMHCFGLPIPPVSFDQLYSALASASLHCITQLTLRILGQDDSWISTGKPGFVDFICSFPSVESLVIPDETLLILNRILPDYPQAFPSLRRVELLTDRGRVVALAEAVSQFISDRKAAKAPILILVIDDFPQLIVRGDWRFLDEYENMYLLWKHQGMRMEYKCGSGEM